MSARRSPRGDQHDRAVRLVLEGEHGESLLPVEVAPMCASCILARLDSVGREVEVQTYTAPFGNGNREALAGIVAILQIEDVDECTALAKDLE
jgi:hypothetical protein